MSSLNFSEIYSSFFTKVEGYDLFDPNLPEDLRNEFLCNYLHSALADRYVSRLFSSIEVTDPVTETDDDGNVVNTDGVITFELNYSAGDFFDEYFLIEMLAYGKALAWVTPKVNSLLNIQMLVTDAQQKYYSQANHMTSLKTLRDDLQTKRNALIADRGAINNDYLDGNSPAATLRNNS